MSEAHFNCDTVSRELWLAILSSLLCSEMDSNTCLHRRESKVVFILTDFKSAVSFLTSISESTVILRLEKVEFFKYINLRNILSIRFVKFEIKQWASAYQHKFCACFSLAQLPTETARVFFSESFSKRNGFIFLPSASRTCSMPRQGFFVPYVLPSHVKYCINSQTFPPF